MTKQNINLTPKENFVTKKLIFNPHGNDKISDRKLVNGNITNLMDVTRVKYNWSKQLYRHMMENFWIPEKINLIKDSIDYKLLPEGMQLVLDKIISSLTFLDSIQTNNLPNISDFITAPEVNLILTVQAFQEAVHSQSYSYLVNSIIPKEKLDNFFDTWKENKVLYARNEFLVNQFQNFVDNPSSENFLRSCIATYVLESISFYMGFNIFYHISFTEKLIFGTVDLIRYINRDEFTHILLFQNLINELKTELNVDKDQFDSIVKETFKFAVENEKKWMDEILTSTEDFAINSETSHQYIEYIADLRLKAIGTDAMYNVNTNPLIYLENVSGLSQTTLVKSNFFESNVTSYNMFSAVSDWDQI